MRKILLCTIVVLLVFSCKKFEEGPNVSLRTMKNRIVGDWEVVAYEINGVDSLQYMGECYSWCSFNADRIGNASNYVVTNCMNSAASWELRKKIDEKIYLNVFSSSLKMFIAKSVDTTDNNNGLWEIIKLTNKEMKLQSIYEVRNVKNIRMTLKKIK